MKYSAVFFVLYSVCITISVCEMPNEELEDLMLGTFEHIHPNGTLEADMIALMEAAEFSPGSIKTAEAVKMVRYKFSKNHATGTYSIQKSVCNCEKGDCDPTWKKDVEFTPGKEIRGERVDGKKYKAIAKFEGCNRMIKDSDFGTFKCHKDMEFDKDGMTISTTCKDKTAVVRYKRV